MRRLRPAISAAVVALLRPLSVNVSPFVNQRLPLILSRPHLAHAAVHENRSSVTRRLLPTLGDKRSLPMWKIMRNQSLLNSRFLQIPGVHMILANHRKGDVCCLASRRQHWSDNSLFSPVKLVDKRVRNEHNFFSLSGIINNLRISR